MTAPSFILVRSQMGENIGAVARAMANFALDDMRLVAPRDGWPNPKAADTAGKALPILDDASLHETTREAVADCQFVLATTSRDRAVHLPVQEAREAMAQAKERIARGEKVGILFGPERTGLENEDIALADAVVMIPVSERHPSLNLGQAAVILGYEWFTQTSSWAEQPARASGQSRGAQGHPTASREELSGFFDQLEAELDAVNFWRVPDKKETMWRNLRATLMRAALTSQEVATWRGLIKALRGL
jgi:tRNA/rRNA methyltransferase